MIDRNHFTEQAWNAIALSTQAASELGHNYVGTEHLLVGLLLEEEGVAARVLDANGVKADKVKELISQLIFPNQNVGTIGETVYTPGAVRVLNQSYREAVRFKAPLIGTEHLLIAMIRESDCAAVRLLNTMDVSLQKLYVDLRSAMGEDGADAREELQSSRAGKDSSASTPTLNSFSRDLTKLAREGKLDPVIGRESEIQRVVQILSRRTKNNPCLIGEPGVGKTAVVEGLAQMIAGGNVPETIADRRVMTLDLSGMVAGSKYRGEFEERIKKVISEVTEDGNVLLFLDEIHTIIGAGGAARCPQLLLRGVGSAPKQIFPDGTGKQGILLQYHADGLPQMLHSVVRYRTSAYGDGALLRLIQPRNQAHKAGLAAAGAA